MRLLIQYIAPLALLTTSAAGLLAQFVTGARLVVLHASVANHRGRLISTLGRDAFQIF
jgi:hypothetical protein